jgi:hypothetical protein
MWRPKNSGGIVSAGGVNFDGPDEAPHSTRTDVEITRRHTTAIPANQRLDLIFLATTCIFEIAADNSIGI